MVLSYLLMVVSWQKDRRIFQNINTGLITLSNTLEKEMPDSNVLLIARFKTKAGKEEEVRDLLLSLVGLTRAEEGCVFYYLHQVKKEKGHFLFYECFSNEEAYNNHINTPYIKGFLNRVDELLAEQPEVTFLEKI